MELSTLRLALGVALLVFCVGLFYAVASARLSISFTKGTYRFRAYLFIGAAICLSAIATLWYQAHLPIYEITGTIEATQVHSEGKGHRTYLWVRTGSGSQVAMSADGISPYFRPGQKTDIRYQGNSGFVLKALFLSDGKQEGLFNGTDTWPPYWWLLGGVLVIAAGIRKIKRDPEGAERA